nr:hypothetical protein [Phaeobacter piscinae]
MELLVDQDTTRLIRFVGRAIAQLGNRRLGDIGGLGKLERELFGVERLVRDLFKGFEDLSGVHGNSVRGSSDMAWP